MNTDKEKNQIVIESNERRSNEENNENEDVKTILKPLR